MATDEVSLVLSDRNPDLDYVPELVVELQTPAQFGTSMLSGELPSGAAAPGSASNYDWTQVFGSSGYFYQTWEQLGISAPAGLTGTTPADALANALGSESDINNMQILDITTNSMKTAAWNIFENIISKDRFNGESPQGQVEFINRLYEVLPGFLNHDAVQDSLAYGYNAFKSAMAAIDTAARTNPNVNQIPGTSFAGAWITYSQDFFSEMQSNLQDFLEGKIEQVQPFWSSSTAIKDFTQSKADQTTSALASKLSNLATNVVIKTGFIQ